MQWFVKKTVIMQSNYVITVTIKSDAVKQAEKLIPGKNVRNALGMLRMSLLV